MQRFLLLGALWIALDCSGQTFTKVYSAGDQLLQFSHVAPIPGGGWYTAGVERKDTAISAFLTRFDEDGAVLWSQKPAESRDPRALVTLNDGSALFFNNNSGYQGYFDASLLHIGANGNFISETIWGKPNDQDDWLDAKKLEAGEVIAIGMSRESSSFQERVLLAKFSATGQLMWEKTYTGGGFGRFSEILLLPSGEFYAIGQNYNAAKNIGMLGKFSANGDLQWVKTYDYGPRASYFLAGQALSDGSVLVAAYQTNQNGLDIILTFVQIDSQGSVTNQKSLKAPNDLGPFKMGKLNKDTLLVAAVSNGQIFPVTDNDNVVLKVSPQGDLLGSLAFGSNAQDFGLDAFFVDNQVIICGMSDTSADGSARRAFVSKSGINASCCEKDIVITAIASPPQPVVSGLALSGGAVPVRQDHVIPLTNLTLTSEVSCLGFEGQQLLPADTTLCIGDTLQVGPASNVSADALWNTGATTRNILVTEPGSYSLTWNSSCGTTSDTILVVAIGNKVNAQLTQGVEICPGESATLQASGGVDYLWSPATGLSSLEVANPVATPDQTTVYQVQVSDGLCTDTTSVTVIVLPAPAVKVSENVSIRLGQSVRLQATGAAQYFWQSDTGLNCSNCATPLANPVATTTYTVLGTDINGCLDTAQVTVSVEQPCPYYLPNVFAPESDSGTGNEIFSVFGSAIEAGGFHLRIYSRWGELVFETRDSQTGWDGFRGREAALPGVYLYQLEMSNCDGPVRTNGSVTLIR